MDAGTSTKQGTSISNMSRSRKLQTSGKQAPHQLLIAHTGSLKGQVHPAEKTNFKMP